MSSNEQADNYMKICKQAGEHLLLLASIFHIGVSKIAIGW